MCSACVVASTSGCEVQRGVRLSAGIWDLRASARPCKRAYEGMPASASLTHFRPVLDDQMRFSVKSCVNRNHTPTTAKHSSNAVRLCVSKADMMMVVVEKK